MAAKKPARPRARVVSLQSCVRRAHKALCTHTLIKAREARAQA